MVNQVLQFFKNYKHEIENLVGMDNHIEELKGFLEGDTNGVRIVGIHGMVGLGKTSMAKVIYNQICDDFEGHCYLADVRAKAEHRGGIVDLQVELVSKIQKRSVTKFLDVNEGRNRIKDAVRRRKVLVVLDDVDDKLQINMLIGSQSWFSIGSRIIITTRDKKVLDATDVYTSYKPDFMDDHHSLQLFCKYAFKRDNPMKGFEIVSKEVVSVAAGLPLVLKVLGSTLSGESDVGFWEEKLKKLREKPDRKVVETLRFSFDLLEYEHKQIFLDIACLFTGKDKARPSYMWDDCGFYPKEGIRVLVSRSLITVDDDDILLMHDQLRDLGRQIVREEGLHELGKRSRLWCEEEAIHVIETRQVRLGCFSIDPDNQNFLYVS